VLQSGNIEKLIKKRAAEDESPIYHVHTTELFDVIKRAHIQTGRGGRDKMLKALNAKYANVTCEAVNLFKELCVECEKKRKRPSS